MEPQLIIPGQVPYARVHNALIKNIIKNKREKSAVMRKELQDDLKAAGMVVIETSMSKI